MDYIPVYHWLQELFPQIDSRMLEVTAKHSKDADAAVEYILTEVLPIMTEKAKVSSRNLSSPGSYDIRVELDDQSSLPRQCDGSHRLANSLIKGPVTDTIQAQSSVNIRYSAVVDESSFYDAIDEGDLPSEILDVEVVTGMVSQDALEASDTTKNQITELKEPTTLHACDDGQTELCRNAEAGRLILLGKGTVKETVGSCSNSSCTTATATLANSSSGLNFSGTVDSDDTDHWKSSGREPHSNGPSAEADDIRIHVILPPYQLNSNSQELESIAFSNHNGSLEDNKASPDCIPNVGVEDVEAATVTSKPGCSGGGNPQEDDGSPSEVMAARSKQICDVNLLEQIIDDAKNNKKTLLSAVESVINMMKEVEDRERAAEMAKEEAEMGGVNVLTKVMELKQMLVHAKYANNMHAGEVYGEKAVLATEFRELQSRLRCLSDERDKALSILDETSKIMESRILEADEARLAAEKEKLKKEESARAALAKQEAIMDKVVQESKLLQEAAKENSRLRDFLMDRGNVVDILQGEISVICQDVRLLKEKFDAQVPLSQSVSSSQTSRRSLSNSPNINDDEALEIPEKSNERMFFGGLSSNAVLEEDRPSTDTGKIWDWEFFDKDTELSGLLGNGNGRSV
ncbi:hypothetical protein MLD38_040534 [Melastoma candidum]|nr:hypothetical protein MLD38_040534 [Melastoma candidum]